jgi:hypothetical protein
MSPQTPRANIGCAEFGISDGTAAVSLSARPGFAPFMRMIFADILGVCGGRRDASDATMRVLSAKLGADSHA